MIENGKRLPSDDVLSIIANVFQKEESWFLDENLEVTVQSDDEEPKKNIPQRAFSHVVPAKIGPI